MAISYKHEYLLQYLPKRYEATSSQLSDRREVYNFKDGKCSSRIKDMLCSNITRIIGSNKSDWAIVFIPASTSYKTSIRYSSLASYIESKTGVKVVQDAIRNKIDVEAKHLSGVAKDPKDIFSFDTSKITGKNIILIDDVVTSGRSFQRTADIVKGTGVNSIVGLFVAKTINPDWEGHKTNKSYSSNNEYEEFVEEDFIFEDEFDYDPSDFEEPDPSDFEEPDPSDFEEPDPSDFDYF